MRDMFPASTAIGSSQRWRLLTTVARGTQKLTDKSVPTTVFTSGKFTMSTHRPTCQDRSAGRIDLVAVWNLTVTEHPVLLVDIDQVDQ